MIVQSPAPALAPFVERYWLCLLNTDHEHHAVPDGRVDLVLEVRADTWHGWAYGSTTRPTALRCTPGCHYLGIRFRPGQSRHFLRASAHELTDRREDARDLLRVPVEAFAEQIRGCEGIRRVRADRPSGPNLGAKHSHSGGYGEHSQRRVGPFGRDERACRISSQPLGHGSAFAEIDQQLMALLCNAPPEPHPADMMVRHIEAAHGAIRLDELAARLGRSPRWLQRLFLETVGVTPKFFALVARAARAAELMAVQDQAPLADVAAQAGYADQSHMTRDFVRLAGAPPRRWQAAFLQDTGASGSEY